MDARNTGALIAARRKAMGLTQKQLAERLLVSDKAVSKWENGASYPEVTLLPPLAQILGITVDELLAGAVREQEQSQETEQADAADTPEKQSHYLKVIRKKCDEINALVTKMIVLTKSEYELSGGNESVLPDAEIRAFIAANGDEYRSRGLRISYAGEEAPPLKISAADFARLLTNIADNSLKYKNGAEGRLQI